MRLHLKDIGKLLLRLSQPLARHSVFFVLMVILSAITFHIVGEPQAKHPEFYIGQLLLDLYVLCAIFCIFDRLGRHHRGWRIAGITLKGLCYTVGYATCFVEAFLYMRFYLAFSPTMLNLAMETNGGESTEFISSCLQSPKLMEAAKMYGALLAVNLVCELFGKRVAARLHHRIRHFARTIVAPAAAMLLLVTTLVSWVGEKWKMLDYLCITETTEAEKISGNVFYSSPLRLVYSYKFAQIVRHDTERLIARMEDLPPAVSDTTNTELPCPTIVLVIGESYNKHHASCYGYPLATTPMADALIRQGRMTVFTDAVTPWNVTSNAFKAFLSTHSTDQSGAWTDGVLFPAMFRQAGYDVGFITNQFSKSKRQNRSDFNGSFFLNDPHLDSLCFDYRNTRRFKYDGGMLTELTACRDHFTEVHHGRKHPTLFIVHLMGQHVLYHERFPGKETVFTPDDYDRPDLQPAEVQVIADYDNATRYNDKVLAGIIQQFRRDDAIVIFLADHGDEVFDGDIGMFGRNHTADLTPAVLRGEFEVPMLIWTSRRFDRRHPSVAAAVRAAAERPFATDDLPHLLFGLAGIRGELYDPQRDLLDSTFNAHRPRPIKGLKNYDDIIKKE